MPQQIGKKRFYFFLLLILFFGTSINNKVFNKKKDSFYNLDSIEVTGLSEKFNLEIEERLNFLKNTNIFFIDGQVLIDQINNFNFIENFNIIKFYPSKILIKLEKTEFLAKTIQNNKYFFIGSNGKFINFEKFDEEINLPIVYGKFTPTQFLKFNKIIKNIDLDHNSIYEIFFYPSGRVDIKTRNNLIIKFPLENVKEAIIIVNKIINNKNLNNNIIDLRVPKQLILSNE
tara:strand:- start:1224 stop:1913 length:690 start_codon:yes stop_codon:yes gene_type:complete